MTAWKPDQNRPEQGPSVPSHGRLAGDETKAQGRWTRLIVLFLAVCLLLFGLSLAFPSDRGFDAYFVRALVILALFGGAAVFWSSSGGRRLMGMAGLWAVIVMTTSGFYLYRSDFSTRFMSALDPSAVITAPDGGMIVHRGADGHFWLRAEIDGIPLRLMVDTGASNVVLSPTDARRIGFDMSALSFDGKAATANGFVKFARARVDRLKVGNATLNDMEVTINGSDMNGSLFGLKALNHFSSFEFRGETLILRP
ncbi:retropepsin-like aspartic protease family protein [Yunchengibacter salinarum]|uniref:retropepsin-like aspartic protease family protein n=1 Tax=Yunchengibacter salinarum TaxID=3133399 RepID=UPI0035B5B11C